MLPVHKYLHLRIEITADSMADFEARVEHLRNALAGVRYSAWIWTDDPRPANPVLYEEHRQS